mmetsp:Transcript_53878/g.125701  ORF Transcript_53878/g.125701 Transcript_53878/m.125701 type:complete len:221 (+) Transcript_53878:444-1106(+)
MLLLGSIALWVQVIYKVIEAAHLVDNQLKILLVVIDNAVKHLLSPTPHLRILANSQVEEHGALWDRGDEFPMLHANHAALLWSLPSAMGTAGRRLRELAIELLDRPDFGSAIGAFDELVYQVLVFLGELFRVFYTALPSLPGPHSAKEAGSQDVALVEHVVLIDVQGGAAVPTRPQELHAREPHHALVAGPFDVAGVVERQLACLCSGAVDARRGCRQKT